MRICMSDLVQKARNQRVQETRALLPNENRKYFYKGNFRTMGELVGMTGIERNTLRSRFYSGNYKSIEEAINTPINIYRKSK